LPAPVGVPTTASPGRSPSIVVDIELSSPPAVMVVPPNFSP
jgi:hypothetical protein